MRIAFSRDRAAQLDLLLRSAYEAGVGIDRTIACYTNDAFAEGYERLSLVASPQGEENFHAELFDAIEAAEEYVTFFCDDDVFLRSVPWSPEAYLSEFETAICVSLRLGIENRQQELPQKFPIWPWPHLERTDFGFPASVDGHTFRKDDLLRMIGRHTIAQPTDLETVMVTAVENDPFFKEERRTMLAYWRQCLVGVPVNRVSPRSEVNHGEHYPQPPEKLNHKILEGYRIDLDALRREFRVVDGVHKEMPYRWIKI